MARRGSASARRAGFKDGRGEDVGRPAVIVMWAVTWWRSAPQAGTPLMSAWPDLGGMTVIWLPAAWSC